MPRAAGLVAIVCLVRRCCVSPLSTCGSSGALELDRIVRVCVTACSVSTTEPLGTASCSCPPVVFFYSFIQQQHHLRRTGDLRLNLPVSLPATVATRLGETLLAALWPASGPYLHDFVVGLPDFRRKEFSGALPRIASVSCGEAELFSDFTECVGRYP